MGFFSFEQSRIESALDRAFPGTYPWGIDLAVSGGRKTVIIMAHTRMQGVTLMPSDAPAFVNRVFDVVAASTAKAVHVYAVDSSEGNWVRHWAIPEVLGPYPSAKDLGFALGANLSLRGLA